ncbi:MAG: DUF1491 family protein [Alphaproteobacteria bacterium]|nr:DUF1491 family protein [Alphaproteobacteria bacterium]
MTVARLKTRIWVQAQIRLCDIKALPIVVEHRGDPDAGTVVLRLRRRDGRSLLLRRATSFEGEPAWMAVGGGPDLDAAAADGYIARELARDRDLWVLEIEDFDHRYELDGPVAAVR